MNAWKLLAVAATMLTLAGCQTASIPTTDRLGTGKAAVNLRLDLICQQWRVQTYDSKKDTPRTVKEARANNNARKGFGCR